MKRASSFSLPLRLDAAELVRLAGHDPAAELLDVVAALAEVLGELVEHLGMAGLVVRAEVVHRVDEAPAEEVRPHPVDERLGQRLVLGVGDQLAQLGAADHVGPLADLPAVEEPREGDADHAVALVVADVCIGRLVAQLGVVVDLAARVVRLGRHPPS